MYKQEKKRSYLGIALSVLLFVIGQILLNYVSVLEDPPGGNTLYIILGTALILFSVIGIFFLVRHILHLNRKANRKRNTKVKFLKDELRKQARSSSEA
ncbi:hypothetical protein [Flavobacterium silvaticum]|uniref:DUF5305 domain-containing protein n=1 Tax=Flavobacterium silvaticum TaxID=1852020 RepID=A0A972FJJ0_9FLAO|nr:hypothetical protein [Flavobacterium silvaticum]NMH26943.1 DUF5305 domain-containing protein [Flavobacterium silvaticum]